jgi:hypothetical protein
MSTVHDLSAEYGARAERMCSRIVEELTALNITSDHTFVTPSVAALQFEEIKDRSSGEAAHCGRWLGTGGYKIGEITLHADGSFYGEYDVVRPHPHKNNWFIEAIVVWGRGDIIKAEARLLPAPDAA